MELGESSIGAALRTSSLQLLGSKGNCARREQVAAQEEERETNKISGHSRAQEAKDDSYLSGDIGFGPQQTSSIPTDASNISQQRADDLISLANYTTIAPVSSSSIDYPNDSYPIQQSGSFPLQQRQQHPNNPASQFTVDQYSTSSSEFYQPLNTSTNRYQNHQVPSPNSNDNHNNSSHYLFGNQYSYPASTHETGNRFNSHYCNTLAAGPNCPYDQAYTQAYQVGDPNYYNNNQTVNNYQISASTYNVHHHHHNHYTNCESGISSNQQSHYSDGQYSTQSTQQLDQVYHQSACGGIYIPLDKQQQQQCQLDLHPLAQAGPAQRDVQLANHEAPQSKETIAQIAQGPPRGFSRLAFQKYPTPLVANERNPSNIEQIDREKANEELQKSATTAPQRINHCDICGRNYARPSTLKTHLRTHTNERPYKCKICGKTFSQAANLTAHQRVHTGERPFSCPICRRPFSQSSSVITHLRTHSGKCFDTLIIMSFYLSKNQSAHRLDTNLYKTGERPYRCKLCSRTFSDSSTLTKHCRIHSGEKPYQCEFCPLNFSQSGNLSRHIKLHLVGSPIKERVTDSSRSCKNDSINVRSMSSSSSTTSSTSSITSSNGSQSARPFI